MAQPAPPPAQGDSAVFRKFSGLVNTATPERMQPDELEIAINVDIDDRGQLHRRQGFRKVATGKFSSLFNSNERSIYGVVDGNLCLINPNWTTRLLQAGLQDDVPLAFVQIGDTIYWSCPIQSGKINQTLQQNSPWIGNIVGPPPGPGVPALPAGSFWLSPVVDPTSTLPPIRGKILSPPPFASCLAYFNGRAYLADRKTLWFTELYLYDYVDRTRDFFQFEADITMVGAVTDGIYVGTTEGVWFLAPAPRIEGHPPGAMKRTRVMDSGVIPGTMCYLPAELANPPQVGLDQDTPVKVSIMFMSQNGYCGGQDGGTCYNYTETKFVFPAGVSGSGMFRRQYGTNQYIAAINSGGTPTVSARVGDHLDATIRRAGTWEAPSDTACVRDELTGVIV